jgi:hypothetical protein
MDIIRLFKNPAKNLCGPSLLYFVVSCVVIFSVMIQNIGNNSHQHLVIAHTEVKTPSKWLILIVNLMGVMLWSWILNLMCKANHSDIAWLVVLFPYIIIALFFVIILLNK